MNGHQGGSFTWSKPVENEMSTASWNSFASNTLNNWDQGKDTEMDAIAAAAAAAAANAAATEKEPIKFNTVVQYNHPHGGNIGDSSTGQMNNNDGDNWTRQEERPDTMTMPMNQIPIRTVFTGPRIINPDDSGDDDDDDDTDNIDFENLGQDVTDFPILKMNSMQDDSGVTAHKLPKTQGVEDLKTFVDGVFLYSDNGNGELAMLKLTKPEHLNMINIPAPDVDYTVAICYHFVTRSNAMELKAIQLYLSTGESYTAIIEQCCLLNIRDSIKDTKFGQLLTDPRIKRVCWCPDYISNEMIQKVGFPIGECVDLSIRANYDRDDAEVLSFIGAIGYYLRYWDDKSQFTDAKTEFERLSSKKFSSCVWDREKLPDAVLSYCALQGLAAYTLYVETTKSIDVCDDQFLYNAQN
jgi:hypothetical protein